MNYKSRKYKKVKKSKKNIKRGGKRSHTKRVIKKSKLGNRNYQKQPRNGAKHNISYYLSRGGKKNISYSLSQGGKKNISYSLSQGGKARYRVLRNEKSPTSYATPRRVKKTQLKKYRKPFGKDSMKGGGKQPKPAPKPAPKLQKNMRKNANEKAKGDRRQIKKGRKDSRESNKKDKSKLKKENKKSFEKLKKKAEGKGKRSLGLESFRKKMGRTKNKIKRLGRKESMKNIEKRIGKKTKQKDRLDTYIEKEKKDLKESQQKLDKRIGKRQQELNEYKNKGKLTPFQEDRKKRLESEIANLRSKKSIDLGTRNAKLRSAEENVRKYKDIINSEISIDKTKIKDKVNSIQERKTKKEAQYSTKFKKLKKKFDDKEKKNKEYRTEIGDLKDKLLEGKEDGFIKGFKTRLSARTQLAKKGLTKRVRNTFTSPKDLYKQLKFNREARRLGLKDKDFSKNEPNKELKDRMYLTRVKQKQRYIRKLNPADRAAIEIFEKNKNITGKDVSTNSINAILNLRKNNPDSGKFEEAVKNREKNQAATKIQAQFRGNRGRQKATEVKKAVAAEKAVAEEAAIRIQEVFRRNKIRSAAKAAAQAQAQAQAQAKAEAEAQAEAQAEA